MHSFTIHFQIISVCSEVFVEHNVCYAKVKEVSSFSSSLVPLAHEAFPNNKKLKRACIESFLHFVTLGSQNPRSSCDTYFIA